VKRTNIPSFTARSYKLALSDSSPAHLQIIGQKAGPPNKRIVLHHPGFKLVSVSITACQKNKMIEYGIIRVNYLPTRQEIRLHSQMHIYPGEYRLELKLPLTITDELRRLNREQLEAIDWKKYLPVVPESPPGIEAPIDVIT
jgi:hypothetical protein